MADNVTQDALTNSTLKINPIETPPISYRPINPVLPFPIILKPSPVTSGPGGTTTSAPTTPGANPSGKGGTPQALLSVSAAQTPVKNQNVVSSLVTVNFTYNTQDPNFGSVNIWLVGYRGNANPQLVASGNASPINFIADATGETVSIFAQTISTTGISAPIPFAAHCTVTLSGNVGLPPAPTISQTLVGTPTGYQFAFKQVVLPSNDEEVIACYNIYRATSNSFSAASLIGTEVPNPSNTGNITFTDTVTVATGSNYYYWVTAINTSGFESDAVAAQSGAVSGSIGAIPPVINLPFQVIPTPTSITIKTSPTFFFTRADGTTVPVGQTTQACTGLPDQNIFYFFPYWRESDQTLQFVKNSDIAIPNIVGAAFVSASSQYVETTTNLSFVGSGGFTIEFWYFAAAGTNFNGAILDVSTPQAAGAAGGTSTTVGLQIRASDGGLLICYGTGGLTKDLYTSGGPFPNNIGVMLNDSTWHHIMFTYDGSNLGTIYVDGQNSPDGVTFWQNSAMGSFTLSGYFHFGFCGGKTSYVQPTNIYGTCTLSHVAFYNACLTQASAIAHMQAFSNMGETSYLSELTYDGAVNLWKLNETSGTTAADSIGSNTGTYVNGPTLGGSSPIISVLGSPAIAWPFNSILALQSQSLRDRTPLSTGGLKTATAFAVSTQGLSGNGMGNIRGGICFTGETLIKTKRGDIPIADIKTGDLCLTAKGTWLPVLKLIEHEGDNDVLYRMPQGWITHKHKILHEGEWINAGDIFTETQVTNEKVYTISMDSSEPIENMMDIDTDRSFTLSNGIIAHNAAIIKI